MLKKITQITNHAVVGGLLLAAISFLVQKCNNIIDSKSLPSEGLGKIRVEYYDLDGHAIDFVYKGYFQKRWIEDLGGQPFIIKNDVYDELRKMIKSYSAATYGDFLNIAYEGDEVSENYWDSPYGDYPYSELEKMIGNSFAHSSAHVGAMGLRYTPHVALFGSEIYNFFSRLERDTSWAVALIKNNGCLENDRWFDSHLNAVALDCLYFWRHAMRSDFDYFKKKKGSFSLFSYNKEELVYYNKLIDLYKYITKDNFPQGFGVVSSAYEGCGQTLYLQLILPPMRLRVAVIENIFDKPIRIGAISAKINNHKALRNSLDEKVLFDSIGVKKRKIYPHEYLKPGEKILIPLQIYFRHNVAIDELLLGKQKINKYKCNVNVKGDSLVPLFVKALGKTDVVYRMPLNIFLKKCNANVDSNAFVGEYIYGSSVRLIDMQVDDNKVPIRVYDSKCVTIQSGISKGSCPYVFTFARSKEKLKNEGHILYGRNAFEKKGYDEIELSRFNGQILIREMDLETSYIDHMLVRVSGEKDEYLTPDSPLLQKSDEKCLILKEGETCLVSFKDFKAHHGRKYYLLSEGYYIPED